jgi:hypothetical protein
MRRSIVRKIVAPVAAAAVITISLPQNAQAVDGVILIDQNRAIAGNATPGDAPGFPISINSPGIYKLASNLVVPNANTTAIAINVNNVTIDFNGFAILGPTSCISDGFTVSAPCTNTGSGYGVDAYPGGVSMENIRIMNGAVNGMGAIGLAVGRNSRIERMNVTSCGADAIFSNGGIIVDTLVRANGGNGVTTSGSIITNSRAILNRGYGMYTSNQSLLSGNIIGVNGSYGLVLTANTRYTNNSIDGNGQLDSAPPVFGGTSTGENSCGSVACL